MATDYFKMMQSVLGSYADGREEARLRQRQVDADTRAVTVFDQSQEAYKRDKTQRDMVDAAHTKLSGLSANGVEIPESAGLDQPPVQPRADGLAVNLAQDVAPTRVPAQSQANGLTLSPAQDDALTRANPVPTKRYRPATDLEINRGQYNVAVASRDMNAQQNLQTQHRELRIRDVHNTVGKLTPEELVKEAAGVNVTGDIPMIYTGKDKNGYTFMTTDSAGAPDKKFTASPDQLRQLVLAKQLGAGGFGKESMDVAGKAHGAVSELIKAMNAQTSALATNANDVLHKGNADKNDTTRAGAAVTSANAAATTAQAHASYWNTQGKVANLTLEGQKAVNEANNAFNETMSKLTPAQQDGVEGRNAKAIFNAATAKFGQARLDTRPPTGKAGIAPEDVPAYRKDILALGLRPPEKVGMLGGKDDRQGVVWDAQKNNIDQVYGVNKLNAAPGAKTRLDQAMSELPVQGGRNNTAPDVPGRPFYNTDTKQLRALATKPRGVSSDEANQAQAELDSRVGEQRIKGF